MIDQDYYIPRVYLDGSRRLNFSWVKGLAAVEVFVLDAEVRPKSVQAMEEAIAALQPFAVVTAATQLPLSLYGIEANKNLLALPSAPGEGGKPRRIMQSNGRNMLLSFDGMRKQVTFSVREIPGAAPASGNKLIRKKSSKQAEIVSCNLTISSPEPLEKGAIVLQVGEVLVPLPAVEGSLSLNLPFTAKRKVQPRFRRIEDQRKFELCAGTVSPS